MSMMLLSLPLASAMLACKKSKRHICDKCALRRRCNISLSLSLDPRAMISARRQARAGTEGRGAAARGVQDRVEEQRLAPHP